MNAARLLLFLAFSMIGLAAELTWTPAPGNGVASLSDEALRLELAEPGSSAVVSDPFPVAANARIGLSFSYTAGNLSSEVVLRVAIRWFDAAGQDVDDQRRQLGFPPVARDWTITRAASTLLPVADNISVPDTAITAELSFRLERHAPGRAAHAILQTVTIGDDEVTVTGLEFPPSGPHDAGPLSVAPTAWPFGTNLVGNGALEDGVEAPTGWQIEGDNSGGAALWQDGGAFSGRRCLKLFDRGPYVRSWGDDKSVYVPGGSPGGNYALAREEVSARWVSEPAPATPGQLYQATAFLWYANRQYLDRGNVNPVRIQFLDARGQVLPYENVWQDWLPNSNPFQISGWVHVISQPIPAPAKAAAVRAAVVMFHAFHDVDGGMQRKRADERGFVLVDNLALYQVKTNRETKTDGGRAPAISPLDAFWDTVEAGAMPFVPSSSRQRQNTLSLESESALPGGILMAGNDHSELALRLTNWLGDPREIMINYDILDWFGHSTGRGRVATMVPPFGRVRLPIERPHELLLGAYTIRYAIVQDGEEQEHGETRFALLAPREVTAAERGRMDYPFSLWNHRFRTVIGTPDEAEMGLLMKMAGMGKTWFGAGGPIYLSQLVSIRDPEARREAIAKRVELARDAIAAWRRYGITPMGHLECPHLMAPDDYPILAEVVTALVSALKEDIRHWRYGTESMHGAVKELDRDTVEEDARNGQGGRSYLYWGRQGTVRQYWDEYFVAFAAAKQADPDSLFGPQCASDIEGNVLRLFFQLTTADRIDCFGMNTYISAFAIWPPNLIELEKANCPDLPIFVSEFDAQARCSPTGPNRIDEEREAVRRMIVYWTSVLSAFPSFFHLEQWGMILGDDNGSLTYRKRVRPQYLAYATMTDLLGAGRFVARHEIPRGIVYVRERSVRQGPVAVLWSTGPEAIAELEVGVEKVTIVDVMGNRRELEAPGGIAVIDLTPMPQYLVGAQRIAPARTVKLTAQHATRDPHRPRLAVTVTNERREEIVGTIVLQPESPLKISPSAYPVSTLRHGESRTFYFDATAIDADRDARLPVRIRLTTPNRSYEAVENLNFHVATRALRPPTIDGDLADWPAAFPLVADRGDQFFPFSSPKTWGGTEDLSGRLWLRWDDANLYLAARVTDEVLAVSGIPGREFNCDAIELLIDPNRGLSKDAPFQMITLAGFQDGQPRVHRYDGPLPKGQVTAARIALRRDGNETHYEAMVPWRELAADFAPGLGQAISIAFTFNDHDGGNSGRRAMSWFSLVSDKNPAAFGDIVLADSHDVRENLLPNGNFEDPSLPPGPDLEGWRLWWPSDLERNARAALVTEGAWAGRCLRIERLNSTGVMTVGGWSLPVQPGEVYLFRARVRASERAIMTWLTPVDAAGKGMPSLAWIKPLSPGATSNYGRDVSLTVAKVVHRDAYQPLEAVFAIPDEASSLSISFAYNWAAGDAFVDDCQLYLLQETPHP